MAMQTKWLFPHQFRLIGWLIFLPSTLLGLLSMYADFTFDGLNILAISQTVTIAIGSTTSHLVDNQNLTDELAGVGVIVGLLLIAFSRERVEDEMIGRLRLEALQWSVYANYLILLIAILTVYDVAFFSVLIYNMFTVLLVFIGRFRWLLYRQSHTLLSL